MQANAQKRDPQRDVLECIRDFIKEHQYAPTMAEICRILGVHSKGTVAKHLKALRNRGLLTWEPGCERTFVITDFAWVALQTLQAFLDSKGRSAENRRNRRYLMRNVLNRPEVRAAIDEQLAVHGLAKEDPYDSMVAIIRGEAQSVQFNRKGEPVVVTVSPLVQLQAIKEYFRLTLGI